MGGAPAASPGPQSYRRRRGGTSVIALAALRGIAHILRMTIDFRHRFVSSVIAACFLALAPRGGPAQGAARGGYAYDVSRGFLAMPDGTHLAVTWYIPRAKHAGERFPALLEFLPYRKDDSFYQRDYPLYRWFARRGFLMAKVDVRGTGGSEGVLPEREYSLQELADATEIIAQLARHPASNGKVGMWGISWGGFNSLMMAARGAPALGAIIALHASDDLYHDDVHYVDGIWHLDPYQLEIDHENGLPRTPDYPLDSAYFADRFDRAPWILTNLAHPVDDAYWQQGALRFSKDNLRVPSYLIGGLLDGYRDTPLRLLDRATVPVKVEIGPWEHAWPDNGMPGPGYEWRERAARWWDHWLGDDTSSALMREPRFLAFVRAGNPPDVNAAELPGDWRFVDWRPAAARAARLYPHADGALRPSAPDAAERRLHYDAGSGSAGGDWWGDRTPDMGADDAGALVFDGAPLAKPLTIVGLPSVSLAVESDVPLANWIARLEDLSPDGRVSLVTGGAVNGPQIRSRRAPARLRAGETYAATIPLHFTTWTFQPGHRVRLAITNAQFPMLWPTPYPMATRLHLGAGTSVSLPLAPTLTPVPAGALRTPEARDSAPDARTLDDGALVARRVIRDVFAGTTRVELEDDYGYAIGERRIHVREFEAWQTAEADPARSLFLGVESHRIETGARILLLESRMDVTSDSSWIRVRFARRISENGALVRERVWSDSARREFH